MDLQFWLSFLPIVIYILLIVLLVVGIILGIKTIITMGKLEKVVDTVNTRFESLNSIFSLIDFTTDKLAMFTDRVIDFLTSLLGKILLKDKRKEREDDEENE